MRQSNPMIADSLRARVRTARERNSPLVRLFDGLRSLGRAEGRALLWTRIAHREALHQTSGTSWPERYPELFDLAASIAPDAGRLLSFGCSSGEELEALRRRFPKAEIVGAEINPRLRKLAAARMAGDAAVSVVEPGRNQRHLRRGVCTRGSSAASGAGRQARHYRSVRFISVRPLRQRGRAVDRAAAHRRAPVRDECALSG